jgi:hypothetical protein
MSYKTKTDNSFYKGTTRLFPSKKPLWSITVPWAETAGKGCVGTPTFALRLLMLPSAPPASAVVPKPEVRLEAGEKAGRDQLEPGTSLAELDPSPLAQTQLLTMHASALLKEMSIPWEHESRIHSILRQMSLHFALRHYSHSLFKKLRTYGFSKGEMCE